MTTEADVSARHVKIAQALQAKALQRLQTLRPEDLSPSEVRQFLKDAATIERDALGLNSKSTVKVEAEVRHIEVDAERSRLAREAALALEAQWEASQLN